ncbi:hypothetical protein DPMN_153046 [Dreissena polymorpha]|uniref:Uncharacterized protein n=1 Tax=Dreissena polymorpha TaxID=45954 RepID=A0A9D4FLJ4_DREPO|nr:hypothetical protein DPMN_153046 [Dreissena polymorpha]
MPRTHAFQQTVTIFEIIRDIITKLFKKCPTPSGHFLHHQDDWKINVISIGKYPAPWQTCFSTNWNHFPTINVASRMLKRKNAPPPGYHACETGSKPCRYLT